MNFSLENNNDVSEAMLAIAIFAALSDSGKSEQERECIANLAKELGFSNASALARQVLLEKLTLDGAIEALREKTDRQLAYEMALAVCEASGGVSAGERDFLNQLRLRLQLDEGESAAVEQEVRAVAAALDLSPATTQPVMQSLQSANSSGIDNSGMILKYAILNAALELLPESLATMAIVPLQIKMVYRIGKSHGVSLDSGHIREFLAAAGLGMGSQMLEGFARKFLGGLGKSIAGKTGKSIASQSAGSAMTFASTYAIGFLADRYYAGGRKLDTASLQSLYQPLREKALQLHAEYLPQIQERSRNLNVNSVMDLVRGNQQP